MTPVPAVQGAEDELLAALVEVARCLQAGDVDGAGVQIARLEKACVTCHEAGVQLSSEVVKRARELLGRSEGMVVAMAGELRERMEQSSAGRKARAAYGEGQA